MLCVGVGGDSAAMMGAEREGTSSSRTWATGFFGFLLVMGVVLLGGRGEERGRRVALFEWKTVSGVNETEVCV